MIAAVIGDIPHSDQEEGVIVERMMYYEEDIAEALAAQPFPMIGEVADELGLETYVIGLCAT